MTLQRHVFEAGSTRLPYLHSPAVPAAGKAPLLLFLHGKRDLGDSLDLLLRWSPPRHLEESPPQAFHFAAPQIPEGSAWNEHRRAVLGLLDHLLQDPAVDARRVWLAGFSLGAAGAWQLAAAQPERFAALVPVSGRVPESLDDDALTRLRHLPVWAFNGELDDRAPPEATARVIETLQGLGAQARFSSVAGADHFISETVFRNPGLYHWLLAQPAAVSRSPTRLAA
jgi:predicted peptidase